MGARVAGTADEDATLVWAAHFPGEMAKAIIDNVVL
ncbi:DUF3077 domain-containing protein [Pseudomonas sp. P66]|uniref:DUF3077 domain-containing protein n=1 Tax=Pseudomonas arcuscaelestis TaxID=2710591 RepID=A0ABS2C0I6_9PSED|nr:DUF3077 domain-containing protein [Pseudomonas arcuscaelestis]MBM5459386.1 DUF3077 domain-containing protein [Pseudomonas arcuscaelestis]